MTEDLPEKESSYFFQLPFLSKLAVFLSPFAHGHSDAFAEHPFYERIGTVAALGDYCRNWHGGVRQKLAGLLKADVVNFVKYRPACGFLEFQCRHAF